MQFLIFPNYNREYYEDFTFFISIDAERMKLFIPLGFNFGIMKNKLFLIDGHALIFRMYYAFLRHPMINSKGADMSILFGFTKYILELIEREKPTHLAIAFDPPGGTFRHEMYPEYKGTRSERLSLSSTLLSRCANSAGPCVFLC